MMGRRFRRKLESTLYAFTSIVLSSNAGYSQAYDDFDKTDDGALQLSTDESSSVKQKVWDPSVVALWSGKLDPNTAKVNFPFGNPTEASASDVASFAEKLLKTGTPALPRAGVTLNFLDQVVSTLETDGFLVNRVPMKRVDVPPEGLDYTPYELCFGAGRGTAPGTYFGTGWSSTL